MRRAVRVVALQALVALGLSLVGPRARAEEPAAQVDAPRVEGEKPSPPEHQLFFYSHAGVLLFLSPARSTGGFGGALGLRDIIHGWIVVQADVGYLTNFGNVVPVQVAAGVQRPGFYSPAALATLTTLLGDRLSFISAEHPRLITTPPVTAGVLLAPVRFNVPGGQLSLLEVGLGISPEFPGLGLTYQLKAADISISF